MPNVLIRGLSDEAVARIDQNAKELGLSRNEYLRRQLEVSAVCPVVNVTAEHWKKSAEILADLADPVVMATAWR